VDTCLAGTPVAESPIGSPECSDGLDNDCDGFTDVADTGCAACTDNDGDGYGSNGDVTCANGTAIDCNDNDAAINPGASDANCNGIDEDCAGGADSGYVPTPTSCGTGECGASGQIECQSGVEVDTCVIGSPVPENTPNVGVCIDGLDNDCDGLIDQVPGIEDPDCSSLDSDDDGDGYTENQGDCDDTDPQVFPGAPIICDGKDSNCDGYKDFLTDEDKDGDGVPWCAGDCNDNNPLMYPGNLEGPRGDATCSDGIDNDCDGNIDVADSVCAPPSCTTKFTPQDGPHIFDLLDPLNNDAVIASSCAWCHTDTLLGAGTVDQRGECQRCHADPSDTSDPLNGVLKDPTDPNAYSLDPPYGFGTALNVKLHSSTVLGTKYGAWDMDCLTCHNPHQQEQDNIHMTSYGKYIKEYICYDNPVTGFNFEEIVEFTAAVGTGSFADGPPHNENICEMCHTQTIFHRNDGSTVVHNDNTNCTDCHLHAEGFKPGCGGCHAVPPPTGSHVAHYSGNPDFAEYGNTGITEDYVSQDTVYVMNCGNCHPMDSAEHRNGVLNAGGGNAQIEFYNVNAPAGSLKALHPPTAVYTPGPTVFTDANGLNYTQGTCSNVYCHSVTEFSSSGAVPEPSSELPIVWPLVYDPPWESFVVKSTQYQSPVWGVDSLGCDGCHGYPITLPPTVSAGIGDSHAWIDDVYGYINMHAWNMGYEALQCNTCHYNTVQAEDPNYVRDDFSIFFNDIPIHNTAYHVNGTKDIAFNPAPYVYPAFLQGDVTYDLTTTVFYPAGTLYPNEATCVNAPCHQTQVEVKWGNPYRPWLNDTECDVCHRN
jgi:predicted CxxxxCH...CXXCH cytochrome family protein